MADEIIAILDPLPALGANLDALPAIGAVLSTHPALGGTLDALPILTGALSAHPTLSASLSAHPALVAELSRHLELIGDVEFVVDLSYLTNELGSQRDNRAYKKLAASAAFFGIGGSAPNFVELPTGLILYPTFTDSGFLEIGLGAAHVPGGEQITIAIEVGPGGGTFATLVTFTTDVFPTNAFTSQWEMRLLIKNHGPTQGNYAGYQMWTDGATYTSTSPRYIPLIGRIFGFNFQDVNNGDAGDMEIRVKVASNIAANFGIRNYSIGQYLGRSGVM